MEAGDASGFRAAVRGQRFRATIAYDGTAYHGYQIQRDRPTVQGALEDALLRLTGQAVRVQGAGRTDSGVHAHGQVISFTADWRHGPAVLQRALNALLPADIVARTLEPAAETFHARYGACRRLYVYTVVQSTWRLPLLERYAHRIAEPLRLEPMSEAARALEGRHDFAAFGQPTHGLSTERHVWLASWVARPSLPCSAWVDAAPPSYQFQIEANGFLRGMVRRIVGTLLEVGRGTCSTKAFEEILASADIARAAPPVPPCGLCLWSVTYADGQADGWTFPGEGRSVADPCDQEGEASREDLYPQGV